MQTCLLSKDADEARHVAWMAEVEMQCKARTEELPVCEGGSEIFL